MDDIKLSAAAELANIENHFKDNALNPEELKEKVLKDVTRLINELKEAKMDVRERERYFERRAAIDRILD